MLTTFSTQTFGQVEMPPKISMVRMGDSSEYDVDPTGKYDLIVTALNRILTVDSLIRNQDTVIVCLDR